MAFTWKSETPCQRTWNSKIWYTMKEIRICSGMTKKVQSSKGVAGGRSFLEKCGSTNKKGRGELEFNAKKEKGIFQHVTSRMGGGTMQNIRRKKVG